MYGKPQTQNLIKELKKKNLDALLLVNLGYGQIDPNFYYFSGLEKFTNSFLILSRNGNRLIVPEFEISRAEKETWIKGIEALPQKKYFENIAKSLKGKKVGINGDFLPLNVYKKFRKNRLRLIDFSKELKKLRMVKAGEEIKYLKKSVRIAKNLFKKINFKKSEQKIKEDFSHLLEKNRAGFAYEPIIAFDKNSAIPHYKKLSNKYGRKTLLIDGGAVYKGYHSDITRTFILPQGKKDREIKKVYNIVKEAHDLAIEKIKPGVKANYIDKVARDYLKKQGFKLEHSLGHGIGLEIHEAPNIGLNSKDVLKEGMVFTVEPGIYLKNRFGVRIEDDVLVTKNGCKVLSK